MGCKATSLTPISFSSISTGKPFKLATAAEEVATFFAKMLDHEYTTKDVFRKNFFKDWKKVMTFAAHLFLSELSVLL